jgi:cytochrome c biogenesis protein CcdA
LASAGRPASPDPRGILLIAAQAATLQYGVLLAVYSLGLGIPFLALGIGFETIAPRLKPSHRTCR